MTDSWMSSTSSSPAVPPEIDTNTAHSARVWNYWLGGKDNFAADRAMGDQVRQVLPEIDVSAREARGFLRRAVEFLAAEAGIQQFLDVGTGIPTANSTHEVAQRVRPSCRIVYVDNDPIVLVHARALLTSAPEGATDYIDADIRDTSRILEDAAKTLDFARPTAVMLLGILNHILDDGEAHAIVDTLTAAVPSGSYLLISHPTADFHGQVMKDAMRDWNERGGTPIRDRSSDELASFFDGFELLEPGVVSCSRWRPDDGKLEPPPEVPEICAVGRKL